MPIYEYKCQKCDGVFEHLVFRNDDPVFCPDCKDDCVERLMSACSFKSDSGYSSSATSSGCASCSSKNCSTCH
ncbi:MAG: zinc ribbon domain-containing protein [Deltaproteobacteria bacterium]|nr:zinc ribbon domain-containing protein [Deltaproteobacteria bacterium]